MNNKWFSGIGLAILLSTGAAIYTTATQARPKVATAEPSAPDAVLDNLTKCATEKNPAYVESVIKGAMIAFDKDAKAALKAGKPADFKKASKNLLKVIKFLFAQSKHFSPIYKDAAHKATFDKDINKLIQSLFHAEYALAKSQSAKKEVIKDYTAVVAEFKKDGVGGLTTITAPSKKAANGALAKMKKGLSNAGHTIAEGAKKSAGKAADGAKALTLKAKEKAAAKLAEAKTAAADDSSDDDAADDESDDASADDSSDDDAADDSSDDDAADDSSDDDAADDGSDDDSTDDSSDDSDDAVDNGDDSDDESDDSDDVVDNGDDSDDESDDSGDDSSEDDSSE